MSSRVGRVVAAAALLFGSCGRQAPNPSLEPAVRSSRAALDLRIEQTITPPDVAAYDAFGSPIVLQGNTLLVSALGEQNATGGSHTFIREGSAWRHEFHFSPEAGATDTFGWSIAIAASSYLIGAVTPGSAGVGAVQVFSRTTGDKVQSLLPQDVGEEFGWATAAVDNVAVVGAPRADGGAGAVYVFEYAAGNWQQVQRVTAAASDQYTRFGRDLSIAANVLVVSSERRDTAVGEVFVFEPGTSGWTEVQTLPGEAGGSSSFGWQVATDGETLLVSDFQAAQERGIVVFGRQQTWTRTQKILEDSLEAGFAKSLAVDGSLAISRSSDAAYVYALTNGVWAEQDVLQASPPTIVPYLDSVSVSGDLLSFGAPTATTGAGSQTGVVVVFEPCSADQDCLASRYCASDGLCRERKANGAACDASADCKVLGCAVCVSGYCVDGVCCNGPCDRACEACAESGNAGNCVAVSGAPRSPRPSCGGTAPCAGACDGTSRECSYVPRQTQCGTRCEANSEVVSVCDGQGGCVEGEARDCGAYACVVGACRSLCTDAADCAAGLQCAAGSCVQIERTVCSADARTSIAPSGERDCGAYLCDRATGLCLTACAATSQCAAGKVCDPGTRNCVSATADVQPTAAVQDAGCTCRTGSSQRSSASALLIGSLLGAWQRRRSHKRRILRC